MSWYKVVMTSQDISAQRDSQLVEAFKQVFIGSKFPQDAALFSNDSHYGEDLIYYFSPGAVRIGASLIQLHSGIPCEEPPRDSLFILGHESFREDFVKGD